MIKNNVKSIVRRKRGECEEQDDDHKENIEIRSRDDSKECAESGKHEENQEDTRKLRERRTVSESSRARSARRRSTRTMNDGLDLTRRRDTGHGNVI